MSRPDPGDGFNSIGAVFYLSDFLDSRVVSFLPVGSDGLGKDFGSNRPERPNPLELVAPVNLWLLSSIRSAPSLAFRIVALT